jgi:hypothetical protein
MIRPKPNRIFFFVCIWISFVSCYSQKSENVKRDFSAFPVQQKLNTTDLFKANQFGIDLIDLYKESTILMISRAANNQKHHINLYDLNKKQFLPEILEAGRKVGQSLSFLSYGIEKNYIWVYDINKEKVISLKMDSLQHKNVRHLL